MRMYIVMMIAALSGCAGMPSAYQQGCGEGPSLLDRGKNALASGAGFSAFGQITKPGAGWDFGRGVTFSAANQAAGFAMDMIIPRRRPCAPATAPLQEAPIKGCRKGGFQCLYFKEKYEAEKRSRR